MFGPYGAKPQTDSRDGFDQTRARSTVAKLAPKPVDRHPHGLTSRWIVVAPYVPREHVGADDGVRVAHEAFEEPELRTGKAQLQLAVDDQKSLSEIELKDTRSKGAFS